MRNGSASQENGGKLRYERDMVVDNGSHILATISAAFGQMRPKVSPKEMTLGQLSCSRVTTTNFDRTITIMGPR